MKILITKTQLFCVFGSPVTVKRGENIVFHGVEGDSIIIAHPNGKTTKTSVVDGSVTVKPYEMSNGAHYIALWDDGERIPVGNLVITEDKATVFEISASDAIQRLAVSLDETVQLVESLEKRIDEMDDEFHQIPIANKSEV